MGRRSDPARKTGSPARRHIALGLVALILPTFLGVFMFLRRDAPVRLPADPGPRSMASNAPAAGLPTNRMSGQAESRGPLLAPPPSVNPVATNPAPRSGPAAPTEPASPGTSNRPAVPTGTNAPAAPPVPAFSPDLVSMVPDRPPTNILEAQIVLSGLGISSGSVDGVGGYQTMQALRAFQNSKGLDETGRLDPETQEQLRIVRPLFRRVVLRPEDFDGLADVPDTWLGKSKAPHLGFETVLESLAERSHASPGLLKRLNPRVDWSALQPGRELVVPNTAYPPARRAALARISLEHRHLRVFDAEGNLLAHFPVSIGRIAERRPVGELEVASVVRNPNYTFNPAVFPESEEARTLGRRLVLPAGPNNPVGVAWIGLSRAGYGIHGTPVPEMVGRTESHGCFRLANWNADYLRRMAWVGMPIWVEL